MDLGTADSDSLMNTFCYVIDLSAITSVDFATHSSHNWQTNCGGTSAFSPAKLHLRFAEHNSTFDCRLHTAHNGGAGLGGHEILPTTIIYSIV
jgi:hypothetical protein